MKILEHLIFEVLNQIKFLFLKKFQLVSTEMTAKQAFLDTRMGMSIAMKHGGSLILSLFHAAQQQRFWNYYDDRHNSSLIA